MVEFYDLFCYIHKNCYHKKDDYISGFRLLMSSGKTAQTCHFICVKIDFLKTIKM